MASPVKVILVLSTTSGASVMVTVGGVVSLLVGRIGTSVVVSPALVSAVVVPGAPIAAASGSGATTGAATVGPVAWGTAGVGVGVAAVVVVVVELSSPSLLLALVDFLPSDTQAVSMLPPFLALTRNEYSVLAFKLEDVQAVLSAIQPELVTAVWFST